MTEETEDRPWHSNVVAVVVHPTEPTVWLPDNSGPLLRIETNEELFTYDVEPLLKMVAEQWGLRALVLRCLAERIDQEKRYQEFSFLLTPRADAMPASGHWQTIATRDVDNFAPESRPSALLDALRDLDRPSRPTQRPWSERGWFDVADGWAIAALHAAGIPPHQPSVQLRTWGLSTVHRYQTSTGDVYFKAAAFGGKGNDSPGSRALLFANEAVLLSAFSARFPGYVPHPIAIDPDRVWMLLPDAGSPLGDSKEVEVWEAAIRIHARHQRAMLGEVDALEQMGCLYRGLDRLVVDIDDLAEDVEAMAFLEPAEQERFRASIPAIKALIADLATLGISDSFVHGDLHPWNVGIHDGHLVLFDWTDACITHPFMDLASYVSSSRVLKDVPGVRHRLRAAYLAEWRGIVSPDALERSADLAETLAMAHQAVSYQHMLRSLEGPSRADMGSGVPYWVKQLLERVA